MAPKRSTHLDDPPSASSDEDETEDEQEPQNVNQKAAESSSSEESEEETAAPVKTLNPSSAPEESSSEEDDEEEESESEKEEEAITTPVKAPIDKPRTLNPNSETDESSEEEEEEIITPVEISKPNPKSEESSSAKEEVTITPTKTSAEKSKTLNSEPDPGSEPEPETELSSPTASAFTIKPSKKLNVLQTPEKNLISKRPNPETATNGRKKSKVSNGDADDDEKKSIIKRVWTDGDEIVLLQGFIDYQSEKGCSPLSDIDDFHGFIKDSLPGNLSKNQVYDKVRRLKKKYRVNKEKGGVNGDDPVFSKPHEHQLFELSKKIWGVDKDNDKSVVKVKDEVKVKEALKDEDDEMRVEMEDFETLYPFWYAGLKLEVSSAFSFPKNGITLIEQNLSLIGKAKAREMEDKWKAHFDDESLLRLKRVKLLGDVCDVVAKAVGK